MEQTEFALVTGEHGSAAELSASLADNDIRVVRLYPRDHNYSLSGPDAAELLGLLGPAVS